MRERGKRVTKGQKAARQGSFSPLEGNVTCLIFITSLKGEGDWQGNVHQEFWLCTY